MVISPECSTTAHEMDELDVVSGVKSCIGQHWPSNDTAIHLNHYCTGIQSQRVQKVQSGGCAVNLPLLSINNDRHFFVHK
jgi:hypothetical protein